MVSSTPNMTTALSRTRSLPCRKTSITNSTLEPPTYPARKNNYSPKPGTPSTINQSWNRKHGYVPSRSPELTHHQNLVPYHHLSKGSGHPAHQFFPALQPDIKSDEKYHHQITVPRQHLDNGSDFLAWQLDHILVTEKISR